MKSTRILVFALLCGCGAGTASKATLVDGGATGDLAGGMTATGGSRNGGSTASGGSGGSAAGGNAIGGVQIGGSLGTGGVPLGGVQTTGGNSQGGIPATGGSTGGTPAMGGAGGSRFDAMPDTPAPTDGAESGGRDTGAEVDPARDTPMAIDRLSQPDLATDGPVPLPDTAAVPSGVYMPPFVLGADVTITLEDEYYGATYTDNGQLKSIEQLLKDHGFNFIRIDTFVNPGATGGFAVGKPETFRDLAHTITLAKRVKKIGMGFMLDLHYSDTWTNPSQQATPEAWVGLSLTALETQVYNYTKDAVSQLKAAGAMPDMVSVGNEITNGMLWETGRISGSNFANFATLLKAGIRAVREIDPEIRIVMHIEKCNNYATTKWWLDGVLGQGVAFDILGQSCYATAPNGVAGYQGTPAEWKTTFTSLANQYPNLKFMIAEYSAQQRAAGDVMFDLPNKRGVGTINWDPTRAYATHPNHPLFSTSGGWNRYVAIPELMTLYDAMAVDYGLR